MQLTHHWVWFATLQDRALRMWGAGSMVFTIMAAWAEMQHQVRRERVTDSIAKRREAGQDLGGRSRQITDSQMRNALRLTAAGEPAAQAAQDLGVSRATL